MILRSNRLRAVGDELSEVLYDRGVTIAEQVVSGGDLHAGGVVARASPSLALGRL
jgi:hypothetical protein